MDYSEESNHAFIIRIWKENREIEGASPNWRGVIEHVPSGEKRYVQGLTQIITFIVPYFQEAGLKTDVWWRWLAHLQSQ